MGRGTSTNTGLSIAYSIAKYIHENIKAKTLFATHFHQLNEMESAFDGIKNYHMAVKYEGDTLTFLHKLRPGGTDESFGIEVAELAGFPKEAVQNARQTRNLIDHGQFFKKQTSDPDSTVKQSAQTTPNKNVQSKQTSLGNFMSEAKWSEIKKLIDTFDLDNMTPIEALQALQKLKSQFQ